MIHIYSIPSQSLLPSPLKLKTLHPQMKHLMCACADFTSLAYKCMVYTIEWKNISLSLICDYSLITYLHIFVYDRAEFLFHFSLLYTYYLYTFILTQTDKKKIKIDV